jgi:gluconate kinase
MAKAGAWIWLHDTSFWQWMADIGERRAESSAINRHGTVVRCSSQRKVLLLSQELEKVQTPMPVKNNSIENMPDRCFYIGSPQSRSSHFLKAAIHAKRRERLPF